jgi:hypothetical protein
MTNLFLALGFATALLLSGCSDVLGLDAYHVCAAGNERCPCKADRTCGSGLQCRAPGICVDANTDAGH